MAISDLPQYAVAQKRSVALVLARKCDNLLREEFSFAFGFVGHVEDVGNHRSPHETYIQAAGSGKCISATELRKATQTSVSLRDSLLKFVQAFGVQTTHTGICNAQSRLDVRLARWLLMAHDRIGDDTLPFTHEFLALMLGVRRPGVTEALHVLRKQGSISYGRGQIAVKDRKRLEPDDPEST